MKGRSNLPENRMDLARNRVETKVGVMLSAALLISGCAVLTGVQAPVPGEQVFEIPQLKTDYHDYAGAIHVHSHYSHDSDGLIGDLIAAAKKCGLDFLAISDHDTLAGLYAGESGWRDGVLLMFGAEISTLGGHYLAFGIEHLPERSEPSPQEVIDAVRSQGGIGFIAHPFHSEEIWNDWAVSDINGLEIYNLRDDLLEANPLWLLVKAMILPARSFMLNGLSRQDEALEKWDERSLNGERLTAIGSVDAHEFRLLKMRVARYDQVFPAVQTHVLVAGQLSEQQLIVALRQGHAYVAHPLLGDAHGFMWAAEKNGSLVGVMGDEIAYSPDLSLVVRSSLEAEIKLYLNGICIEKKKASFYRFPVEGRGVYRVELWRRERPWIYSNPIYIE